MAGNNNKPPDKRISALAMKNDLFFSSLPAEGCYISSDKGKTWTKSSTGLFMVGTINKYLVHPNGDIFAVSDWDGICRSTDNGATWETELIPEYKEAYDIIYSQNGEMFASVKDGGVYKSTDNGINWVDFNSGLDERAYRLASNGMFVYAVSYNEYIYKSSIQVPEWEELDPEVGEKTFSCIAIGDNGEILAGTYENGIYKSNDLGESWDGINEGMETAKISNIYVNEGNLYTCVFGDGVHLSDDIGNSWEDFNEGFEELYFKDVFSLAFTDDGYIYASAFKTQRGQGLFKREMPTVGIEENMIDNINLRIYPNPVSDNTCIDISLTESSNVLVELFDLTGRKIIDIHKGYFDAGNYRIPYDCSELSSGSYILKVNMNGNNSIKLVYVMR
ncbi:T9SS type A sorting domain-containing protein [Bacteroidota bacterium]